MKSITHLVLCTIALGGHVLGAEAQEQQLPESAFSIGMLTSFVYTAEAYRTLCRPHVSGADLDRYIESWFARNQALADKISEAGGKMHWNLQSGNHAEAWQRMREQDAGRVRTKVAETIAPAPRMMCLDGMRPFRDRNYELSYFPFHLKALGVVAQ